MNRLETRKEIMRIMARTRNAALKTDKLTKAELTQALNQVADQLSELADKLATA